MNRRFEIQPRAAELGGGWRLRLLEIELGGQETERGGGVFPPQPEQGIGEDWLAAFVENQA
ncbi:MAG: hypothetical protein ACRD34_17125 [Bryobacteraceae bacterium]